MLRGGSSCKQGGEKVSKDVEEGSRLSIDRSEKMKTMLTCKFGQVKPTGGIDRNVLCVIDDNFLKTELLEVARGIYASCYMPVLDVACNEITYRCLLLGDTLRHCAIV